MAFLDIFFNREKLAATNAKYKARMAAIDANYAAQRKLIADAQADNLSTFKATIAANNARLKETLSN